MERRFANSWGLVVGVSMSVCVSLVRQGVDVCLCLCRYPPVCFSRVPCCHAWPEPVRFTQIAWLKARCIGTPVTRATADDPVDELEAAVAAFHSRTGLNPRLEDAIQAPAAAPSSANAASSGPTPTSPAVSSHSSAFNAPATPASAAALTVPGWSVAGVMTLPALLKLVAPAPGRATRRAANDVAEQSAAAAAALATADLLRVAPAAAPALRALASCPTVEAWQHDAHRAHTKVVVLQRV